MAKPKRATENELGGLHDLTCKIYTEMLKDWMQNKPRDKHGNLLKPPVLAEVNAFLRNNGIECVPEENNPMDALMGAYLPFGDIDKESVKDEKGDYKIN